MSRQATNYLVGQLEGLGYLERRAASGERRLIYLTERGWKVAETIYAALRQLQKEWADKVGQDRFSNFMDILRRLAAVDQKNSDGRSAGS
jgi:DNA-binding MarR family transcriptional regulator